MVKRDNSILCFIILLFLLQTFNGEIHAGVTQRLRKFGLVEYFGAENALIRLQTDLYI